MGEYCGTNSVKSAVRLTVLCSCIITTAVFIVLMWFTYKSSTIEDLEVIFYSALGLTVALGCSMFVTKCVRKLTRGLSLCFPYACGHRKCVFTGRSSKTLGEIIMSVDEKIPTEQKLKEFTYDACRYSDDFSSALLKTTGTSFHYFFSGSVVERFGIPLMLARYPACCRIPKPLYHDDALVSDLDIMFFPMEDKASLSGEENIVVVPLITDSEGFTGYAQLNSLVPGLFVQNSTWLVSSKLARHTAQNVVLNTHLSNIILPSIQCCCGICVVAPIMQLFSKGPTMKLRIGHFFEADITPSLQCPEWPYISDWATRPRYWPSVADVQRIMSLGCHLVAKPAPGDKDETSWRFSFSLAEIELSKLVPDTARKCFLALKIIFKDHLKPIVPEISSYHMKTIFLNTLEKVPVGFWVEDNLEECFLTLLAELREALVSMNCPHHWFSCINLFQTQVSCCACIEVKGFQIMAEKVERILEDPAPFIFDDGCCCLSPCCFRAPPYNFTRRTSEQFLAAYEEVMLSADGHVIPREQHRVGSGYKGCQPSVSSSVRCDAQLDPSSYSVRGNQSHEVSIEADQIEVPVPPIHNAEQGASLRPGEAKHETNFCHGEAKQEANVYPDEANKEASFCPEKTKRGANFCPAKAMQKASFCPEKEEKESSICFCEAKQGANFCPDEAEQGASSCSGEADGHVIAGSTGTLHRGDPCNHRYQLPVPPFPRFEAQDPSIHTDANYSQEITTEPEQHVACLPAEYDAEQDPSSCSNEVEDNSFGDSLPILVSSSSPRFLARLQQFFKVA